MASRFQGFTLDVRHVCFAHVNSSRGLNLQVRSCAYPVFLWCKCVCAHTVNKIAQASMYVVPCGPISTRGHILCHFAMLCVSCDWWRGCRSRRRGRGGSRSRRRERGAALGVFATRKVEELAHCPLSRVRPENVSVLKTSGRTRESGQIR